MTALRQTAWTTLLLALAATATTAQTARFVDAPRLDRRGMTYDAARSSLLLLGSDNLHALRGGQWQRMPAPALPVLQEFYGVQLFAPRQQGRLLAITLGANTHPEVFASDGLRWENAATNTAPQFLDGVLLAAFDHSRNELVTIGGNTGGVLSWTFDETWVFDGATWQARNPTNVPPRPVNTGVIAYDDVRQVVVLLTGFIFNNYETWEWNGVDWQFVATANTPPSRRAARMAFDSGRGRMVLFGGENGTNVLSDCWEYDGVNWQPVASPPGPGRQHAAMAYDPTTAATIVVGGNDGTFDLHDAWAWDGASWTPAQTFAPAPRSETGASFAIEPGNTSVLMYGGGTAVAPLDYLNETWRWNGAFWTPVAIGGPISLAFGLKGALMWSQQNETHLLFGKQRWQQPGGAPTIVWPHGMSTWNGSGWSTAVAPSLPPTREVTAIAVDTLRNEAVLFGGIASVGGFLADTWVFDGSTWTQRTVATHPSARAGHTMAYDSVRDRVVLYGGGDVSVALFDTWEWDGTNWSLVPTTMAPPSGTMAFNPTSNDITLVATVESGQARVWNYDGTDWSAAAGVIENDRRTTTVGFVGSDLMLVSEDRLMALRTDDAQLEAIGTACTPDAPSLGANQLPRLGSSNFAVELLYGPSNGIAALAGADAALPTPVAALGCMLHVNPTQALALLFTGSNGSAEFYLPIPNQTALLNLDLYFQGATLSSVAPQGITLTRALRARLGR